MASPRPASRVIAVLVALICTTLLGGCVTHLRTGSSSPGSIVHDGALTLDFRQRPTRADVGFGTDRNVRSYEPTGQSKLQSTLIFPTGQVVVPATDVTIATDTSGGALDHNFDHEPKQFTVSRLFASGDDARASLTADAHTLGLSQDEIDLALPQIGTGAVVPQQRVLHGLVDSWLSVDVELMDDEGGQVSAQYAIGIDVYHNPAIDKVVQDGVFTADLTHKPTRSDLGMLDGYSTATLQPAWQQTLAVRLTLPDGVIDEPVSNITTLSATTATGDPEGKNAPVSTAVQLTSSDAATLQQRVTKDAAVLGLDAAQVAAIFASPAGGNRVQKTLAGRGTSVYDVAARFDVTAGGTNAFSAAVTYTFTFH